MLELLLEDGFPYDLTEFELDLEPSALIDGSA
jgi:hypothetical protein